ncbi:helix-turn-helix domain-containing protein [Flavobacterium silvaticum]|uniref:Helix-turn-helix transcriptional regulator n=1 Tax=Flavobacterium silvaticum TaxID=1852020 RepID=A0A972FLG0_9FLAO|nr:AraC family transcriptional regulator [Flavobacterium silvaticum]NMH28171.1 helix-turn-helix transcriptional regulator [Flavobacterium silvaticum]
MNLSFLQSLIIVGIVQGFVLAALLLRRNEKQRFYLGILVLSFALDNLQYFAADCEWISEQTLVALFLPYGFLSAPLYLLYNLSISGMPMPNAKTNRWLFLPFFTALAYSFAVKLKELIFPGPGIESIWLYMEMIFEFACIILDFSVLIYLMRLGILKKSIVLRQTRISTWFLMITCTAWAFVTVADYFFDIEYWNIVYINMSVIIYALGHTEMLRKKVTVPNQNLRVIVRKTQSGKSAMLQEFEDFVKTEKRYLDPHLNMERIASDMDISKSHLSRVLNGSGTSFPDYLNKLRVEEAKMYLADRTYENYTITAIGLEAGFASKTTFNGTFKKLTGFTPSGYRQSVFEKMPAIPS